MDRHSRQGEHGGFGTNCHAYKNSNDFTTFFFANFPNGYGELDMIKIFRRWARVKEVFISRRLNKWGRRFGFVRFFEVRNVGRLEKDLDQIYIGNKKLHVNVPKYRRSEMEAKGQGSENRAYRKEQGRIYRKPQEESPVVHGQKRRTKVWRVKAGSKSYADVIKGDAQRRWEGPTITTEKKVLSWMKYSMVGQFKEELSFEELEDEFLKGGMSMVRVRSLGDNLALLTPREEVNMKELIDLNKEWFESVLQKIEPWTEESVAEHRVVWVRCYGLPLPLWTKDCFSKLVGEEASLVSIDETTVMWENLEYARLQVRLLKNRNARMVKSMMINEQEVTIYVEEEKLIRLEGQCMCHRNYLDTSDSISSSETYVEESDSSVFNGEEEDLSEGKVRRPEEKEEEGADMSANTTKAPLSWATATKGDKGQNKATRLYTKEETKGNEEAALVSQSEQDLTYVQNHLFGHAELARLVVDLECRDTPLKPKMHPGQKCAGKAHSGKEGEAGQNLSQKEIERILGSAYEPKEDDERRYVGNSQSTYLVETGSRTDNRQNEPNSSQEGRIAVEKENQIGVNLHGLSEEEAAEAGTASKTQSRKCKLKALRELGDANTYPRQSVRLSEKTSQKKSDMLNREGMFSASISDGDIFLCNARVHSPESRE